MWVPNGIKLQQLCAYARTYAYACLAAAIGMFPGMACAQMVFKTKNEIVDLKWTRGDENDVKHTELQNTIFAKRQYPLAAQHAHPDTWR